MPNIRPYRGKRIDNGEWVNGWYLVDDQWKDPRHCIWTREVSGDFIANDMIEVDPETVGQYTGLKDKYGKEIYEGDIILNAGYNHEPCIVEFDRGQYIGRYKPNTISRPENKDDIHYIGMCFYAGRDKYNSITIIGNIHDNPNLLEVGQND